MDTLKLAAVLACLALPLASAEAWVIEQIEPAPGTGLAESRVILFDWDPNVDLIEIHKYFLYDEQPLVLEFTREALDQDTIKIVDEICLNMFTAEERPWIDFHVALLVDQFSGDTVVFDKPELARAWQMTGGEPRLGGVPIATTTVTQIDWETTDPSQYVPWGSFMDAPINQLVLKGLVIDVSGLEVGHSFQLKEWPTTPEPGAIVFLGLGTALAALKARRRRG